MNRQSRWNTNIEATERFRNELDKEISRLNLYLNNPETFPSTSRLETINCIAISCEFQFCRTLVTLHMMNSIDRDSSPSKWNVKNMTVDFFGYKGVSLFITCHIKMSCILSLISPGIWKTLIGDRRSCILPRTGLQLQIMQWVCYLRN